MLMMELLIYIFYLSLNIILFTLYVNFVRGGIYILKWKFGSIVGNSGRVKRSTITKRYLHTQDIENTVLFRPTVRVRRYGHMRTEHIWQTLCVMVPNEHCHD